ncbi:MAG: FHA domain-containing protein, partial [Bdellovibrionota bacterium]
MIAQCPSCRRRIRIALPQVVDRNLVRCSECWSVFLVAADELRTVAKERAAAVTERTDGELSRRFADWEKRSLETKRPPLDDLPASPAFDWTGFDEAEDSDEDVGEGTILSSVREKAPEGPGEVLFTLAVVEGPQAGLSVPVQKAPYVLGREGVDFVLNDPEASRRHACIQVMGSGEGRRYELEDAGST